MICAQYLRVFLLQMKKSSLSKILKMLGFRGLINSSRDCSMSWYSTSEALSAKIMFSMLLSSMLGNIISIHSQARITAKCIFSVKYVFCRISNPIFLRDLKHQSLLIFYSCTKSPAFTACKMQLSVYFLFFPAL